MKTKLFTKDFTLVVIGQIISLFGNAILRFALPLYLLRETGSALIFGLVTAASFVPIIVLSFLGGVLADRVNKRNIMVILDFLTAIVVGIIFILIGKVSTVPLLIVTLMILYGISGVYQPTVQASIPALVKEDNILPAGAITNQIGALAGLLGPIVGGILFGMFGIKPILIVCIICFLISAIMELFIKIPFEKRDNTLGITTIIKNDFIDSKNYIKNDKPIFGKIIWIVAAFNLAIASMIIVGTPVLIIKTLSLSDELLGFAQGALALGGLCGGIFTAIFSKKLRIEKSGNLLFASSLAIGVMAIPLLLNQPAIVSYIIITAMSFVMMALATIFTIQMLAVIQTQTPPELVGKIIALIMAISMSAQPLGQALYGFLFEILADNTGVIILFSCICGAILSLASIKTFSQMKPETSKTI